MTKEISVAIAGIVGDVPAFLARRGLHAIETDCARGGRVVVEKECIADLVRVSRRVGDQENFACYVRFAGADVPGTLDWNCDPNGAIRNVLTLDCDPASRQEVDALHDALGLPVARRLAA